MSKQSSQKFWMIVDAVLKEGDGIKILLSVIVDSCDDDDLAVQVCMDNSIRRSDVK